MRLTKAERSWAKASTPSARKQPTRHFTDSVIIELQRLAGNRAVAEAISATKACTGRLVPLQRGNDAAPPKRPTPKEPIDTASGRQLTFPEMYDAIQTMRYDLVKRSDLVRLDKGELRTLHSLIDRTILLAKDIADKQATDKNYALPAPFPNYVYKNVVDELKYLQSVVSEFKPNAALKSLLALGDFSHPIGSDDTAQRIWKVSAPKVRELLWREELGSIKFGLEGDSDAFNDSEILKYGYILRRKVATETEFGDPENWGILMDEYATAKKLDEETIVKTIRQTRTIVPLKIASSLVAHADTTTRDELIQKVSEYLDDIVWNIRKALSLISNSLTAGANPFVESEYVRLEKVFLDWVIKQPGDSVYGQFSNALRTPSSIFSGGLVRE